MSMFTDGYNKGIFNCKNFSRYTDTNISSVCPYVFDNFLIVYSNNYITCFDDNEKLHLSMIQNKTLYFFFNFSCLYRS